MVGVKEHWEEEEPVPKCKHYYDDVVNPKHYCSGANECIDVMEWMFGTEAVIEFCRCNVFKYRFRAHQKNGEEDIRKAEWYEKKLKQLLDKIEVGERMHE